MSKDDAHDVVGALGEVRHFLMVPHGCINNNTPKTTSLGKL